MKTQRDPLDNFKDEIKRRLNMAGVPCYLGTRFCDGRAGTKTPCAECESRPGCQVLADANKIFLTLQLHLSFWKKALPGVLDKRTETNLNRIAQDKIETLILLAAERKAQ